MLIHSFLSLLRRGYSSISRKKIATPWKNHPLPQFSRPPAMLSTEEMQLLHWLTSEKYMGRGEIVDAGCFLGGSTVALADGLRHNQKLPNKQKQKRITSYDWFIADWYASKYVLSDRREGEEFYDLFLQNIKPYENYVRTVKGDIRLIEWGTQPIEIFFIDVAKEPDINDILIQRLFPYLIPQESFVIHQDYVHAWLPWIHVSMEYFAEYFTLRDFVPIGSAVYQLIKPIPTDKCIHFTVTDLSPDSQVKLMDQAITKTPFPERKFVTAAKVRLLYDLGRMSEARQLLNELSQQQDDEPLIAQVISEMKDFISRTNK